MSLCINPTCTKPQNSKEDLFCQTCGTELLLEGRYRVLQMLGAGGCGKTYEVSDRDGSVKVLKILINNDPKYIELFQREAFLLSHLRHPGIPSVETNAYFTTLPKASTEPLHCLVMEKIIGLDLHKYLRQRGHPLDQKLALQWIRQLVQILQAIHHQNILHRDIKPSNIMLKSDGNLALVDFGTARSITNIYDSAGQVQATRIMSALYTPDEQMKGHPVPQSDFFALGRTFVYLLTGQDLGEFYKPLTADFEWHDAVPHLSPAFVEFLDQLMAPLPAQRPATAEEILSKLQTLEQELLQPPSTSGNLGYAKTLLAHPEKRESPLPPVNSGPLSSPPPFSGATSAPSNPPSPPVYTGNPHSQAISSDFLAQCQLNLAERIGPIAAIVCQRTLAQRSTWTQQEFVNAIAQNIPDPQAAQSFRQALGG
ncbi:serine/threonine protein kinase [Lyngbya confervoides]|uniref:non-specific serine/threonine protein kinase n=1 Tax=Lyngbya confervoides BDU141951 TaxID=1574623 RepID=A0ABD4T0B4_9CYAN|nr:serine/threonine-protein kinase [Lyngbya confervoides]MCM1981881.1 serine/threonine protein kinase [Lyngbya confervoides BDU141951]